MILKIKMKKRVIKIKIGDVYINGKNHPVFTEAWEQNSKEGNFFIIKHPVFINEVEVNDNKQSR